jgi:hypothetical protein
VVGPMVLADQVVMLRLIDNPAGRGVSVACAPSGG